MSANQKASSSSDSEQDTGYEIYCSLCKTGFSSTVPYEQHLLGNKHKKAATKQYMKEKYGKKYIQEKAKLDGNSSGLAGSSGKKDGSGDRSDDDDDDDVVVITCEICKKVCTGETNYKLHLLSRAHAKKVRSQKLIEQMKKSGELDLNSGTADENSGILIPTIKPFATCEICDKEFTGPEAFRQHTRSETHKKGVQFHNLTKEMERAGIVEPKNQKSDVEDDIDQTVFARCNDCNKTFSGPWPYQQHMISKAHKKQKQKIELTKKLKDHVVVSDEESTFRCKECNKQFSGPESFQRHLASNVHEKQQKKEKILNTLSEKFPELYKSSSLSNKEHQPENLSDEEVEDYLACNVCHKSFSGPEAARDHFNSKKHLKAKREKQKIEALLKEQKNQNGKSNFTLFPRNSLKNSLLSSTSSASQSVFDEAKLKERPSRQKISPVITTSNHPKPDSDDFEMI